MPLKKAFILSILLSCLKLWAFMTSGSAIVLASFFDSLTDSLVSYLNYVFFVRARAKPDAEHSFGHGGFEVLSSLMQGVMITTLAMVLVYETLSEWSRGIADSVALPHIPWSLGVMTFSALAGFAIQALLGHYEKQLAAKKERSLALSSDRAHYLTDFWTNGLGAIGLLGVWWWESHSLDQVLGLVGAGFLVKTAYPLLRNSLQHVMQSGLSSAEQKELHDHARACDPRILGTHRLRSRYIGPHLFIDFHLKLPASMTLAEAHDITEKVTEALSLLHPHSDILIHLDPDTFPPTSRNIRKLEARQPVPHTQAFRTRWASLIPKNLKKWHSKRS